MKFPRDQAAGLKPMLFVHIPKTAGTSIRNGAAKFLGRRRLALDYGAGRRVTSPIVSRHVHESDNPAAFRIAFDQKGLKFFGGHVKLKDHIGYFDLDNVATFLRDPVQRVLSSYRHFVRNNAYKNDIETFVSDPKFQNRQAHALAGVEIERIGFVGLVEQFSESLRRLNEHFGWEIPPRASNLGERPLGDRHEVEASLYQRILEYNRLDQSLYEHARSLFERDEARQRPAQAPAVGACKLHDRKVLRGWACRIGSERASSVRVEVDGSEVARLHADLYRSDIQQRGYKRSGCAGFEVSISALSTGKVVRCFECDGNTELQNSPIRVA